MSGDKAKLANLQRNQRALLRRIHGAQVAVEEALAQNPSEPIAYKAKALLGVHEQALTELKELSEDIAEATDIKGKTETEIDTIDQAVWAEYAQIEQIHADLQGKVSLLFNSLKTAMTPPGRMSVNRSFNDSGDVAHPLVRLPDIKVPTFDGNLENYTDWRAIFEVMVWNNEALTPVQRLYFLKQAMVGSAKELLKDFRLEDAMANEAWAYVNEKYYNRRIIIASHFRRLLNLTAITMSNLRESLDRVGAIIRGLKVCDIAVEKMSPFISFIINQKLPEALRLDWENSYLDTSSYPPYDELLKFLQRRCFAYESSKGDPTVRANEAQKASTRKENPDKQTNRLTKKVTLETASTVKKMSCSICQNPHHISFCPKFLEVSVADRYAITREKDLCVNCLRKGHMANVCPSSACRKCGKRHNTLLHREIGTTTKSNERQDEKTSKSEGGSSPKADDKKVALPVSARSRQIVLLPSAVVKAKLPSRTVLTRVLLDTCSQATLVTEAYVRRHRLRTYHVGTEVSGVSGTECTNTCVSLCLLSRHNGFSIQIEADVISKIPYHITAESISYIEKLQPDIPLAECLLPTNGIDLLIGGQHVHKVLLGRKRYIGDLCMEETHFGWVTQGPVPVNAQFAGVSCQLTVNPDNYIRQFWESENVGPLSASDPKGDPDPCELHFQHTHSRLPDGRFLVHLPFKESPERLAKTYANARNALLRFESKSSLPIRAAYCDFMAEYIKMGHMKLAPKEMELNYFIPHHPVLKPYSSTTKLRVVFNASFSNNSGISLNDALMKGPVLQPELFETLLRFRKYPVAFSADISKMYRQVAVHPDHQKYQPVLWRNHPDDAIRPYILTTLTYGTTPASYIATKCLQVLADRVQTDQPDVAEAVAHEFYMDDLLSGADTAAKAVIKRQQICSLLESACFPLRKFVSNSREFLSQLEPELLEELRPVKFSSAGSAKILGLQWIPVRDQFKFEVECDDISNTQLTKRQVASLAARVYDPLGFITPITIRAKIILQDLWKTAAGWDDPLDTEIEGQFRDYYASLKDLGLVTIPRAYLLTSLKKYDLIGFSDASERAYGAAVYMRVYHEERITSTLVCSKSRVAPIKPITIPRLELLGAVLLTQLLSRVSQILGYPLEKAVAYSDSTIVLAWMKGTSEKYKTFVQNRIQFITSSLASEQWRYVGTKENPADLMTRGLSPQALANKALWINGPCWLTQKDLKNSHFQIPEMIETCCHLSVRAEVVDESLIQRFAEFNKLVGVVSRIFEFRCRTAPQAKDGNVSYRDIAFRAIIRLSQSTWFHSDIRRLKQGETMSKDSRLCALSPFLDKFGLLRVGGRLDRTNYSYDTRHPYVLHRKSALAELIARHIHKRYFHATKQFMVGFVHSRFYIVGGALDLVKKTVNSCVWCARQKGMAAAQLMGSLPLERATPARPFSFVGVDFAGPFQIKCVKHRTMRYLKAYTAIFVCFSTRAVHLEVVSDLSSAAFLAALQRFVGRRGIPRTIFSDNATNFIGAERAIKNHCQQSDIGWQFITPHSPHQGGLWEAAVKAMKKYLIAATKGVTFDYEQLATTIAQIEAILNSRPLYGRKTPNNPESIDVLTPGHFLTGSHLLVPDLRPVAEFAIFQLYSQQGAVIDSFWRTWRANYLAQLQGRSKWKTSSTNIQPGDIVIIKEDSPSFQWPMAVVTEIFPGHDGLVRQVSVRTGKSTYHRSIQGLVKLPVQPNQHQTKED